jgi:Arc/MetJ-type ribon-helix-helix transcriptional regulator
MKVSVSLPTDDVSFLDEYVREQGYPSRSAALHEAIRVLREMAIAHQMSAEYEQAWAQWRESGDEDLWAATTADGLDG